MTSGHSLGVSEPPTKGDPRRGELRKRDLAVLCLGAVLGTSMYSAFMPTPRTPAPRVLRIEAPTSAPCTPTTRARAAGTRIDVEWHGRYYPARVLRMTEDGRARIHYEDYGAEWDEDVTDARIRDLTEPGPIAPGRVSESRE